MVKLFEIRQGFNNGFIQLVVPVVSVHLRRLCNAMLDDAQIIVDDALSLSLLLLNGGGGGKTTPDGRGHAPCPNNAEGSQHEKTDKSCWYSYYTPLAIQTLFGRHDA